MRSTMKRLLITAATLAAATGTARAHVAADVFAPGTVSVTGIVGIGTPVGELGAELAVAPIEWLELTGAVGTNIFGAQFALGGRARLPFTDRWSATLGGGWSEGAYGTVHLCWYIDGCGPDWRGMIQWANVEGGFEYHHRRGFALRIFAGLGIPLNPDGLQCRERYPGDCAGQSPGPAVKQFPSVGAAVGYWF
jgi:hypothetical protein